MLQGYSRSFKMQSCSCNVFGHLAKSFLEQSPDVIRCPILAWMFLERLKILEIFLKHSSGILGSDFDLVALPFQDFWRCLGCKTNYKKLRLAAGSTAQRKILEQIVEVSYKVLGHPKMPQGDSRPFAVSFLPMSCNIFGHLEKSFPERSQDVIRCPILARFFLERLKIPRLFNGILKCF